jgi:hypothetical protein
MNERGTLHIDNRDPGQMYEYLEARIDVLKRRIFELERENQVLRVAAHGSDEAVAEESPTVLTSSAETH